MLQDRFERLGFLARFLRLTGKPFFVALVVLVAAFQVLVSVATKTIARAYKALAVFLSLLRESTFQFPQITLSSVFIGFINRLSSSYSWSLKTFTAGWRSFLVKWKINTKPISLLRKRLKPRMQAPQLPVIKLPVVPNIRRARMRVPRFITYIFFSVGTFLVLGGVFYVVILKDLPHPRELVTQPQAVTTKIYDRNRRLLYKIYQEENRSLVSLDELPDYVIESTLAIEDSEFYQHSGFSIRGIMRALQSNASSDESLQGGSTITQQLVKNVLLTPERTYVRKIKELVLAVAVESYFTKDEILNMYINQVGYGGTAYGIEEAAQLYFGKSAWELSLPEAALLAGLPAAPTTYSPYGAHPELALQRQAQVIHRMNQEGYISATLAEKALGVKLTYASPRTDIVAPHFVMHVRDLLVQEYGERRVSQGGLDVVTSLDRDIQELAELALQEELTQLESLNVTNASAMVTDPKTGEVLAMVGSRDYFDTERDGQVNVALRPRQPGSSIKPVTYALALEHGYTAGTVLEDAPITYTTPGSPPYSPKNYDGRFHGKVTVRQALANSYNIPAVITLHAHGVDNMIDLGEAMGIHTWDDRSRFGLALTLGGGEVTLYDMMSVYGTLANLGMQVDLKPMLEVVDSTGEVLHDYGCASMEGTLASLGQAHAREILNTCGATRVLKPATAYILSDILSDNRARTPSFGSNSVLVIPNQQVAVKTGTTNSLRDNWTIGYTQDYVVGVWVGNNDNTPMSRVASGITGASPIWSAIMQGLLSQQAQPHRFTPPEELIAVDYCPLTKTLSCKECPNSTKEYFLRGTEPTRTCNRNLVDQILRPTIARD